MENEPPIKVKKITFADKAENFFLSFGTNERKKVLLDTLYMALAFFLPFALLILLFTSTGFGLFSQEGNTVLSIDAIGQYIAYLRYYRRALLEGTSLVYTESKAFGGSFLSLFTYYLASPFNLFLVFVSEADIPLFFLWTSILKMCFGSLNFYIFFRYLGKAPKAGYLMFSVSYAFLSYNFVYLLNFMWLDEMALLPLILLAIERIKDKKGLFLYPFLLGYSLIVNWYIGALACYFIAFYLLITLISIDGSKNRWIFFRQAVLLTFLGVFLASVCLFPTFFHMEGTKATFSLPTDTFYPASSFFSAFLENNYVSVKQIETNSGYMTAFCGVIPLVFFLEFFFNKGYSKRERITLLIIVVIYFFVSSDRVLYTLFHGGREPTWFPTRYSFVLDALIVAYAGKSFLKYEKTSLFSILGLVLVPLFVLLICIYVPSAIADNLPDEAKTYTLSLPSLLIYSAGALVSYLPLLIHKLRKTPVRKATASFFFGLALTPLAALSVYRGADKVLSANAEEEVYQTYAEYLKDDSYQEDVDALLDYDKSGNYRMELTFNRPGNNNGNNNNPMFYSYPGLSHYSSTEIKDVQNYMKKIGFYYNWFQEKYYSGSTLAMNAYLGIKYLLDSDTRSTDAPIEFLNNPSDSLISELNVEGLSDEMTAYRIDNTLPLGYTVPKQNYNYVGEGYTLEEKDEDGNLLIHWYDLLEYQNNIYKHLCHDVTDSEGNKKDIFTSLTLTDITNSSGLTYESLSTGGYSISGDIGDTITFYYELPEDHLDDNLYFTESSKTKYVNISVDNSWAHSTYWREAVCGVKNTSLTLHKVSYALNEEVENLTIKPSFYYEDQDILREYLTAIGKEASWDLTPTEGRFSFGYKGTFTLENEGEKDFLFTLPYEDSFHVYIDGKERETKTAFNIFTAVNIDDLEAGTHEIEIEYVDTSFYIGALISLVSFVLMIVILIVHHVRTKGKKKTREEALTKGLLKDEE